MRSKWHLLSRPLLILSCLLSTGHVGGVPWTSADEPLALEIAEQDDLLTFRWRIHEGYTLNPRETRFIPPSLKWTDPLPEKVEYEWSATVEKQDWPQQFTIEYQGCSKEGFCLRPIRQRVTLKGAGHSALLIRVAERELPPPKPVVSPSFQSGSWLHALSFLGAGLLLALSPCIWPMLPIVLGVVLGSSGTRATPLANGKHLPRMMRTLLLSSLYVLSMAACYAALGAFSGQLGVSLHLHLQKPPLIGFAALTLIWSALLQFEIVTLKRPRWLTSKRTRSSTGINQPGSYWNAVSMGLLSALLISPCVTPVLIGALTFIAQTGDWLTGAVALFLMAIGMGLPLIAAAFLGPHLLPRSGPWMVSVKHGTGILLLAASIWTLGRILDSKWTLMLWGAWWIGIGIHLDALEPTAYGWPRVKKWVGCLMLVAGLHCLTSAWPLSEPPAVLREALGSSWQSLKSPLEFGQLRNTLRQAKQPVLLRVTADWCPSCKAMDPWFKDLAMENTWVLDLSKETPEKSEWIKQLGIFGPPALICWTTPDAPPEAIHGALRQEDLRAFVGRCKV